MNNIEITLKKKKIKKSIPHAKYTKILFHLTAKGDYFCRGVSDHQYSLLLTYFEDVIMSVSGLSVAISVMMTAFRSHGAANGRVHLTKNGRREWKDSSIKSAMSPSSGFM